MITIIVAILIALITFVVTRLVYTKRISNLTAVNTYMIEHERNRMYTNGWTDGRKFEQENLRLENIRLGLIEP